MEKVRERPKKTMMKSRKQRQRTKHVINQRSGRVEGKRMTLCQIPKTKECYTDRKMKLRLQRVIKSRNEDEKMEYVK